MTEGCRSFFLRCIVSRHSFSHNFAFQGVTNPHIYDSEDFIIISSPYIYYYLLDCLGVMLYELTKVTLIELIKLTCDTGLCDIAPTTEYDFNLAQSSPATRLLRFELRRFGESDRKYVS